MQRLFELSNHYKRVIRRFDNNSLCVLSLFDECNGAAVNSHSISAANLKLIANDSEVIRFGMNMVSSTDQDFLEERPMTVRLASCFKGFCKDHDRDIFKPIDSNRLNVTPENVALYMFRATAQELFKKSRNLAIFDSYEILDDAGLPNIEKRAMEYGTLLGLRDNHAAFMAQRKLINSQDFSEIKYANITFPKRLPFAYLAATNFKFFPQYHEVDDQADASEDGCVIGVIPVEGGSQFIFAWKKGAERIVAPVVKRFKFARSALQEFVFQLGLEHSENIFFEPKWINSLSRNQREKMKQVQQENIHLLYSNPSARPFFGILKDFECGGLRLQTNSLNFRTKVKGFGK
jgi:hypothetical protein